MKVLHIITKSNWGGAQRHVFDVVSHLQQQSIEVSVACGIDPGNSPLSKRLQEKNIQVHTIENLGRDISALRDISSLYEIYKIIKKVRPDVLHLHSSKVGLLGGVAGRMAGVRKIVFTAHGTPFNEDRNPLSKFILYILSYVTVLLSHTTICVSKKVYADYPKLFCLPRLVMIHNGIDEPIYLAKNDARQSLSIEPQSFCIGTVAELHPNKGLLTLLKSIAYLDASLGRIQIHILGGGEQETELKKYCSEHSLNGSVVFHGFVSDAHRYIPGFDIFVLPSINEGLPYVLLEAANAKVPIVASNVGGVPEVVIDGVTGRLFKKRSAKALAQACNEIMGDRMLAATFTENMYKHVTTEFSEEKMIQAIIKVYENNQLLEP